MPSKGINCRNWRPVDTGEDWRDQAACLGADTEQFFPPKTSRSDVNAVRVKFCNRCPVQDECLATALRNGEYGVWGGRGEKVRQAMRRDMRKAGILT